jgi:hypothetical protein
LLVLATLAADLRNKQLILEGRKERRALRVKRDSYTRKRCLRETKNKGRLKNKQNAGD